MENYIFCLKSGQDLKNRVAHRHQEFPGAPPRARKDKEKEKMSKKNTWSEDETLTFFTVLWLLDGRDKPWAVVLENLALRKNVAHLSFLFLDIKKAMAAIEMEW